MSIVWRQLMRAAVRLYPASWRRRYEAEMVALLDDTHPARASQFVDIIRSGAREWIAEIGRLMLGPWLRPAAKRGAGFLADASGAVLQAAFLLAVLSLGSGLFPWVANDLSWFGAGPWTTWSVVQIAGLTLRAMILTRLPLAFVDHMYRRAGREPVEGRWRTATMLLSMCTTVVADSVLARQFDLSPRMTEFNTQFGHLPFLIWVMAWTHATRQDRARDVWRVARNVLTAPYRFFRQGTAA